MGFGRRRRLEDEPAKPRLTEGEVARIRQLVEHQPWQTVFTWLESSHMNVGMHLTHYTETRELDHLREASREAHAVAVILDELVRMSEATSPLDT